MAKSGVYLWRRPDKLGDDGHPLPLYVGKGGLDRALYFGGAKRKPQKHLYAILKKLERQGLKPLVEWIEYETEAEAFAKEIKLIAHFGRLEHGGPLVNRTDGGEGPSGMRHAPKARRGISVNGAPARAALAAARKGVPVGPFSGEHLAALTVARRRRARLTIESAARMRSRRQGGATIPELMAEFGVGRSMCYYVLQGQFWKEGA